MCASRHAETDCPCNHMAHVASRHVTLKPMVACNYMARVASRESTAVLIADCFGPMLQLNASTWCFCSMLQPNARFSAMLTVGAMLRPAVTPDRPNVLVYITKFKSRALKLTVPCNHMERVTSRFNRSFVQPHGAHRIALHRAARTRFARVASKL